MRLVRFDQGEGRAVDAFGSIGFDVVPLVRVADGHVVCARLEPGGRIGRHPAAGRQLLAVVAGGGSVSGADGIHRSIAAGEAAVWEPGEEHETCTDDGLVAVIVEGEDVDVIAGPA